VWASRRMLNIPIGDAETDTRGGGQQPAWRCPTRRSQRSTISLCIERLHWPPPPPTSRSWCRPRRRAPPPAQAPPGLRSRSPALLVCEPEEGAGSQLEAAGCTPKNSRACSSWLRMHIGTLHMWLISGRTKLSNMWWHTIATTVCLFLFKFLHGFYFFSMGTATFVARYSMYEVFQFLSCFIIHTWMYYNSFCSL
jgi:hypothetical protein